MSRRKRQRPPQRQEPPPAVAEEPEAEELEDEPDVDDTPPLDFTPAPGVPQPDEDHSQGVVVAEAEEDGAFGDTPEQREESRELAEAADVAAELGEDPPQWEQAEQLAPLQPPAQPDLEEPPVFPLGPLAAGIQMLDAMLEQAKAGYISERVDQLETVLREEFGPEDRMLIADYASRFRDGMGLPDVSGAYEQLVARRAEEVRAAEGAEAV